jgi:ABC-2 type transport system permease protein/oleandomycin transport system permease protein
LDRLTLPAPRGSLVLVEEAAAELRRAEIGVSEMGPRGPTLDDVFLQLTGQAPSENGRPESAVALPESPAKRPRRLWRPRAPSLRDTESGVTDTAVVTMRNLRHFWRQPDLLIFSTIQPIMFVFLFVYVFGGAIGLALPPGVTYVDYVLPGILVQSVTFRASQTAVGLSEDLRKGVIDRFRSMPMARWAVLLGRTTADLVRNVLITGLMVFVGYLIGFRFQAGVLPALGCVALVAAFGFALSWIFAFVSLVVRGAESAQTAGFVILFPLVFASSIFVPVSTLPSWLQPIAEASPVTLTADAARHLALIGGVPDSLWKSLAWIVGILAVFVPLSVWRYRRMS